MKPKYIAMRVETHVEIQGVSVPLSPGGSIGACFVYETKAKAQKDFPGIRVIEIELIR